MFDYSLGAYDLVLTVQTPIDGEQKSQIRSIIESADENAKASMAIPMPATLERQKADAAAARLSELDSEYKRLLEAATEARKQFDADLLAGKKPSRKAVRDAEVAAADCCGDISRLMDSLADLRRAADKAERVAGENAERILKAAAKARLKAVTSKALEALAPFLPELIESRKLTHLLLGS